MYDDNAPGRIAPLSQEHLPVYEEVIRKSFALLFEKFNLTADDCPEHAGNSMGELLAKRYEGGYFPFGYFKDGAMVGFVSLTDKGGCVFEMNHLSVLPDYRHLGIGKAMLDFCKKKCAALGGSKIVIEVLNDNIILKKWYIENEFVCTGTTRTEDFPLLLCLMEWVR
ncbi:MAG: GNAT family N-acetyltransferase [Defluviitaleaceae bacterium]|nr:GNAT family N-acetyltransferase [Defluviitaleaceae bacterium]